jgi:hypothetical protein
MKLGINVQVGAELLVRFAVASAPIDPSSVGGYSLGPPRFVWKHRRVLGFMPETRVLPAMVRVLDYHLEPVDVPLSWTRLVP